MPTNIHVDIHVHDHPNVTSHLGKLRVNLGSANVWVDAATARKLAAGLMIAADQLDPQDDYPEVARTLRDVINGGAS